MARTKKGKSLEDIREEARYPRGPRGIASFGDYISPWGRSSPGDGTLASDGVLRRRIGNDVMRVERHPGMQIVRWEAHRHQGITTQIALYRGDPCAVKSGKRFLGPTKPAKRSGVVPKKWKKGTVALREIRKYQGSEKNVEEYGTDYKTVTNLSKDQTRLLIPKACFQRIVRQLYCNEKSDLRITAKALEALQTAAEQHLVDIYQDANLCCIMEQGQTLKLRHMRTAGYIRRDPIPVGVVPRPDGVPPGNRQPSDYSTQYGKQTEALVKAINKRNEAMGLLRKYAR